MVLFFLKKVVALLMEKEMACVCGVCVCVCVCGVCVSVSVCSVWCVSVCMSVCCECVLLGVCRGCRVCRAGRAGSRGEPGQARGRRGARLRRGSCTRSAQRGEAVCLGSWGLKAPGELPSNPAARVGAETRRAERGL